MDGWLGSSIGRTQRGRWSEPQAGEGQGAQKYPEPLGQLQRSGICYTGNRSANSSAQIPSAANHTPTTISTYPPQRLMEGALARTRSIVVSRAPTIRNEAANRSPTRTTAATTNARKAAPNPPVASPCPARPARIGPVHPKPASRYPN